MWQRDVVVINIAQLPSKKPEFRFCAGSSSARGVSEIRNGENLRQWSRHEIRLKPFFGQPFHKNNSLSSSSSS